MVREIGPRTDESEAVPSLAVAASLLAEPLAATAEPIATVAVASSAEPLASTDDRHARTE